MVRELYFSRSRIVCSDDGEILGYNNNIFESGKLLTQSEKNYISFSLSDHARAIPSVMRSNLKYEIDSGYSGLWREAAGKLLAKAMVSNSDIQNIRLNGWNDEWFASETAFNAAVSSGQITVQRLQVTIMECRVRIGTGFKFNYSVPSYADIKAQVDSWLDFINF